MSHKRISYELFQCLTLEGYSVSKERINSGFFVSRVVVLKEHVYNGDSLHGAPVQPLIPQPTHSLEPGCSSDFSPAPVSEAAISNVPPETPPSPVESKYVPPKHRQMHPALHPDISSLYYNALGKTSLKEQFNGILKDVLCVEKAYELTKAYTEEAMIYSDERSF